MYYCYLEVQKEVVGVISGDWTLVFASCAVAVGSIVSPINRVKNGQGCLTLLDLDLFIVHSTKQFYGQFWFCAMKVEMFLVTKYVVAER